jgi:hypothetical protein
MKQVRMRWLQACSTQGTWEVYTKVWLRNQGCRKMRRYMIRREGIVKRDLNETVCESVDCIHLPHSRNSCVYGNELPGSAKEKKFFTTGTNTNAEGFCLMQTN